MTMRKVVALAKVKKQSVATAALKKWEGDLLRFQKDFGVKVKDDMRVAILLEMMRVSITEVLCQHVEQNRPFLMKYLETRLYFDGARPMDPNSVGEHQPDQRSDEHGDEELDLTICLWSWTSMSATIASSTFASEPFFLYACANPYLSQNPPSLALMFRSRLIFRR